MKVLLSIGQWIVVICACLGGWWLCERIDIPAPNPMPGYCVIIFSLACAFVWVEVLKWGSVRPFNCVKCLTGWFSLILAAHFHVPHFYLYLPLGVFIGAVYSAIQMRWL
jgi:hypothetical protein